MADAVDKLNEVRHRRVMGRSSRPDGPFMPSRKEENFGNGRR